MTALLNVDAVSKRFGGVVANDAVSLRVNRGQIYGLIGPNGSGKTTLFNSIAGTHAVDSGQIMFDGRDISMLRVGAVANLGLLRTFQQTRIYGAMSCLDNMRISVPQRTNGLVSLFAPPSKAADERALDLLNFVGLFSKRLDDAGDMSFGQQKLLEFAMALMSEPTLLLLDEPTAGINPTLINGLIDRLKRANAELGVTLLIIEHNMRVMMNLADEITCLAHGRVLAHGAPDEVRTDARVVDAYLGAA